jgi:hypothetical protein
MRNRCLEVATEHPAVTWLNSVLGARSFRWRVPLRWYLISLLAPLLIFLIAVMILDGFAPLGDLA